MMISSSTTGIVSLDDEVRLKLNEKYNLKLGSVGGHLCPGGLVTILKYDDFKKLKTDDKNNHNYIVIFDKNEIDNIYDVIKYKNCEYIVRSYDEIFYDAIMSLINKISCSHKIIDDKLANEDIVLLSDKFGVLYYSNSESDFLDLNVNFFNQDINSAIVFDEIIRRITDEKIWTGQLHFLDKNGKKIKRYTKIIPVDNNHGALVSLVIIISRSNEHTVDKSEIQSNILPRVPYVAFSLDRSGHLVDPGSIDYSIINLGEDDFKEIGRLIPKFDMDDVVRNLQKHKHCTREYIAEKCDGVKFPVICYFNLTVCSDIEYINVILVDISAFSENENRLGVIVNNICEYIYSVKYSRGKAVSTYHSPKCYDITGYTQYEYAANPFLWLDMIYEADKDGVLDFFETINKQKRSGRIEHRIVTKEGQVRWVLNTCSVTLNSRNNIASLNGIIIDITDEKIQEESLIDSEKKFRSLIENGSDIIMLLNLGNIIQYASPSVIQSLGYYPEDLYGKNFIDFVHPEDKYTLFKVMSNVLLDHSYSFSIICRIINNNNNYRVLESKGSYIIGDAGIDGVVINSRDITEKQELLDRLEELALYDELTGLYNRRGFNTIVDQQIKISNRTNKRLLLFFVDMDNLKVINDKLGHEKGDIAIKQAKQILEITFRESDIIARIGGDEFICCIIETSPNLDKEIMSRLEDTTNRINKDASSGFNVGLSVGLAYYDPRMPLSIDETIRKADMAMYESKRKKKYKLPD